MAVMRRAAYTLDNLTTADSEGTVWQKNRWRRESDDCSTSSGFSSCSSPEGRVPPRDPHYDVNPSTIVTTMSNACFPGVGLPRETHPFFDHVPRGTQKMSKSTASHQEFPKPLIKSRERSASRASSVSVQKRPSRIRFVFKVSEESDKTCLRQIFKPFVDMIDPDLDVLRFMTDTRIEPRKWPLVLFGGCKDQHSDHTSSDLSMPPLGLVLLLQESEIVGCDRLARATEYLRISPWKFHHSEWVAAHRIKAYPYNSLDYFSIDNALPVCSARQVHEGQESLRIMCYVSHDNWQESYNLYKLIMMQEPDYDKPDFCVFTIAGHRDYTIQFALKRLPPGIHATRPCHAALSFIVPNISEVLPLLPFDSHRVSETRWRTADLDGNEIYIEQQSAHQTKRRTRPKARSRSLSSRKSIASNSSFADILLDTAAEFIAADDLSTTLSETYISSDQGYRSAAPDQPQRERKREPLTKETLQSSGPWVKELMEAAAASSLVKAAGSSHHHTDSGFMDDNSHENDKSLERLRCSVFPRASTPLRDESVLKSKQTLKASNGAFSPYSKDDCKSILNIRATPVNFGAEKQDKGGEDLLDKKPELQKRTGKFFSSLGIDTPIKSTNKVDKKTKQLNKYANVQPVSIDAIVRETERSHASGASGPQMKNTGDHRQSARAESQRIPDTPLDANTPTDSEYVEAAIDCPRGSTSQRAQTFSGIIIPKTEPRTCIKSDTTTSQNSAIPTKSKLSSTKSVKFAMDLETKAESQTSVAKKTDKTKLGFWI